MTALLQSDMTTAVNQTVILLVVLAMTALVTLILITVLLLKRMLRPMKPVVEAANRIANGDLDISLVVTAQDEIGILAKAFSEMTERLKNIVKDMDYCLGNMADGNFNVKTQAEKSSNASKSTAALIEDTIQAVNKGISIASATAESLNLVAESSRQVVVSVEKIASAAEEQASSIAQVTDSVDYISGVVQTNSATAEESAATSEELSAQAQMLKNLVGQFKLKESRDVQLSQVLEDSKVKLI